MAEQTRADDAIIAVLLVHRGRGHGGLRATNGTSPNLVVE